MDVISSPEIQKLILSLDTATQAEAHRVVDALAKHGNLLGMPLSKYLTDGILELRTRGNPEIRILYCFINNKAYLLTGFIKKSQKLPKKALYKALIMKKMLDSI
jgi:phage-related protein